MTKEEFDRKMIDLIRRGDQEKVAWIKKMNRIILPSQLERIQQNDKTVLREMVVPKWVTWGFLREWAENKKIAEGRICIFCHNHEPVGIDFKEKFICDSCFLKIKTLE